MLTSVLPECMQSSFAPTKNKAVDVPFKQGEFDWKVNAAEDATSNPKYDISGTPELTDPPHSRNALNSVLQSPGQVIAPIREEEVRARMKDEPVGNETVT